MRVGTFFTANALFIAIVAIVSVVGGASNPRLFYLVLLAAICSCPILFVDKINGSYVILIVFLFFYFLCYSVSDLFGLVPATKVGLPTVSHGVLSVSEMAVLVAATMLVLGYLAIVAIAKRYSTKYVAKDWPFSTTVAVGLSIWTAGILATWVWQTVVERDTKVELGSVQAACLVLGRMVQPVGDALLAYQLIASRRRALLLLVLGLVAVEFVFGFVTDSKELSIRGLVVVLLAKFLLDGKVPMKWIAVTGLIVIMSFAIFQAYRFEVLQTRAQSRSIAAQDMGKNLETTLKSDMLSRGYFTSGLHSVVERISLKPTMELVVSRVGNDVAYQKGFTIELALAAFVPRAIWPAKPDSSVGQLFNRQFGVSWDPDTYISATHSGELYWNFGWPGLILGMFLIGCLLGLVNSRFALAEHKSVTRFLVLVTTIYLICLRFEGGIALQYTLWIRSLGLIMILHWLFARKALQTMRRTSGGNSAKPVNCQLESAEVPFENLMT
jgi:hypothetical protein